MVDSSSHQSGGGTAAQSAPANFDVSQIPDQNARRAVRFLVHQNQQLTAQLERHQMEIEALLAMMVEKHVGSIGEFKRHMQKLAANDARSGRLHEQVVGSAAAPPAASQAVRPAAVTPATPPPPPATVRRPEPSPASRFAEPEIDRPRRYTL